MGIVSGSPEEILLTGDTPVTLKWINKSFVAGQFDQATKRDGKIRERNSGENRVKRLSFNR